MSRGRGFMQPHSKIRSSKFATKIADHIGAVLRS